MLCVLPVQVTQLGHVKDLSTAFVKCLDNDKAAQQIYNISGDKRHLLANGAVPRPARCTM